MFSTRERHYTVVEVATILNISTDTVRRNFKNEPGVIHFGKPKPNKRVFDSIRIPESVLARVYERLQKKGRS